MLQRKFPRRAPRPPPGRRRRPRWMRPDTSPNLPSVFAKLTPDQSFNVFSFLSSQDICRCTRISRLWAKICQDERFWESLRRERASFVSLPIPGGMKAGRPSARRLLINMSHINRNIKATQGLKRKYKLLLIGDCNAGVSSFAKCKSFGSYKCSVIAQGTGSHGEFLLENYREELGSGSVGLIAIFDITQIGSLGRVVHQLSGLKRIVKEQVFKRMAKVLVGNKADLEIKRALSFETARQASQTLHMAYVETSVLTGQGVKFTLDYVNHQIALRHLARGTSQRGTGTGEESVSASEGESDYLRRTIETYISSESESRDGSGSGSREGAMSTSESSSLSGLWRGMEDLDGVIGGNLMTSEPESDGGQDSDIVHHHLRERSSTPLLTISDDLKLRSSSNSSSSSSNSSISSDPQPAVSRSSRASIEFKSQIAQSLEDHHSASGDVPIAEPDFKKSDKEKTGRLPIPEVPLVRRAGSGSEADSDNDDDGDVIKEEKEESEDPDGQDAKDGDGITSDQNAVNLDPGEMSSYGDDERTEQESDYPASSRKEKHTPKLTKPNLITPNPDSSLPTTPTRGESLLHTHHHSGHGGQSDVVEELFEEKTGETRKKSHSRKGASTSSQRRRPGRSDHP